MPSWKDLYNSLGNFTSDVINIASDFSYYLPETINTNFDKKNGNVSVELRVSFDNGVNWSDWVDIWGSAFLPMFDVHNSSLSQAKLQYRITINNQDDVLADSPTVGDFYLDLVGVYKIINTGDVKCKPEIWITKTNGSGNVSLINESNGVKMEFKNLNNGETVYIDCENEDIVTDLPLTYRYKDHNEEFMVFEVGENLIHGIGSFTLQMRMEFKTLQ